MKKPDIALAYCIIIALFICAAVYGSNYEPPLRDEFAGKFVSGEAMDQIGLSIDADTNEFFYEDQGEGLYIRGRFTAREDGAYDIACLNPDNAAIIPDQTVIYADREITMIVSNISDKAIVFRKVSDVPIFVRAEEQFS